MSTEAKHLPGLHDQSSHGRRGVGDSGFWGAPVGTPLPLPAKPKVHPAIAALPPALGEAPLPEGMVRMYHQTSVANVDSVRKNGLLWDKGLGIEGPKGVWVSDKPFYGDSDTLATVEIAVPKEDREQMGRIASIGDVPPSRILTINETWHDRARRYANDERYMQELWSGGYDDLLQDQELIDSDPAVRAIKYLYDNGVGKPDNLKALIEDLERKARRVRDSDYWGAPVGTPLPLHKGARVSARNIQKALGNYSIIGLEEVKDPAIRALAEEVADFEWNGFSTELSLENCSVTDDSIIWIVSDIKKDGETIGYSTRGFGYGDRYLNNSTLTIDPAYQGQGFAEAYYEHVERIAQREGMTSVQLTANDDVGGYAWARRGFTWITDVDAERISERVRYIGSLQPGAVIDLGNSKRGEERYVVTPKLRAQARKLVAGGRLPSPAEIAALGEDIPNARIEKSTSAGVAIQMWPGKSIMLSSSWLGEKPIGVGLWEKSISPRDWVRLVRENIQAAEAAYVAGDHYDPHDGFTSDYNVLGADLLCDPLTIQSKSEDRGAELSELVALLELKGFLNEVEYKFRRVRDAQYWGMPAGTPIKPGMKPVSILEPIDMSSPAPSVVREPDLSPAGVQMIASNLSHGNIVEAYGPSYSMGVNAREFGGDLSYAINDHMEKRDWLIYTYGNKERSLGTEGAAFAVATHQGFLDGALGKKPRYGMSHSLSEMVAGLLYAGLSGATKSDEQIDIAEMGLKLARIINALEAKERRVRTQAGSDRFGQPIGSIIRAGGFDVPNTAITANIGKARTLLSNIRYNGPDYERDEKGKVIKDPDTKEPIETGYYVITAAATHEGTKRHKKFYVGYDKDSKEWIAYDEDENEVAVSKDELEFFTYLDQLGAAIDPDTGEPYTVSTTYEEEDEDTGDIYEVTENVVPLDRGNRTPPAGMRAATKEERDAYGCAPAWVDVWLWEDASGKKTLGYGFDDTNRRQYIQVRTQRNQTIAENHVHISGMRKPMPKFDKQWKQDIENDETARVICLLRQHGMRVGKGGNTRSAVDAFGATMLLSEHVTLNKTGSNVSSVTFDFPAKGGKRVHFVSRDPHVIRAMSLAKIGKRKGEQLFPNTNYSRVSKYIKDHLGPQYSPHDLRTYLATSIAASEVLKLKGQAYDDPKQLEKAMLSIAGTVSSVLHNTPSVALGTYIAPSVFYPISPDPSMVDEIAAKHSKAKG